jgi:FkbM family methyltransferase
VFSKTYKYLSSHAEWRFRPPLVESARRLEQLGSEYGCYFVDTGLLPGNPVIYSLGIGEDISFDLALIERHGYSIYAFDPTPRVASWLRSQPLPAQFHFQALGIADFDGEAQFYLPPRAEFVSHSILNARQYSSNAIQVPVAKLSTLMGRLGHRRIDLLKMDIEGAEYSVLADIVNEQLEVNQIVVEFHHRLSGVGTNRTRQMLALLRDYGMQLCYVCPRFEVMTLVSEAGLAAR